MRSTFQRQLTLTVGMILLSFVVLGCSFTSLFYNYMLRQEKSSLSTNASAVAAFVSAQSELTDAMDWELQLAVGYGANVSDTEVLISDVSGVTVFCSCGEFYCDHVGKSLEAPFLQKIDDDGYVYTTGILNGIYGDERYLYALPVRSAGEGSLMGYVVVSRATEDMSDMMNRIVGLFLMTALIVLLVAVIAAVLLTRRYKASKERGLA